MTPSEQRLQDIFSRIDAGLDAIAPAAVKMLKQTKRHVYVYLNEFTKTFFFDTYDFEGSPNTKQIGVVYYKPLLLIAGGVTDEEADYRELERCLGDGPLEQAFTESLEHNTRHMAVTAVFI